jgi:hypothetical protein
MLEGPIALRKTEERLSRNLQRPELEATVGRIVRRCGAAHVAPDSLLVLDPGEVSKKYAQKMEFLDTVRDGIAHDPAQGYWTLHVIATQVDSSRMVPLYQRLWSTSAPDCTSENDEILQAVDPVREHVGVWGVWVIDRDGDRITLFAPLLERCARFLVRLVAVIALWLDMI